MDWQRLIDEGTIRSLLTERIAHFAHPIREALVLFLSGLPASAQQEILSVQAALPPTAKPSQRLGALLRLCPVLHKLAQSLARDRRLAPELRAELRNLEMLPPAVALETVQRTLREELGPLDRLGVDLDPAVLAEASVAVVIGYRDQGSTGVFKILKPNVEERLEQELELLGPIGAHLDERCAELGIPKLGYEEVFGQARKKLLDEVQLGNEQRHLVLAAKQFARDAAVKVPALRPYCTRRVTAMERIEGRKVTEHGLRTAQAGARLARLIANALLVRPVLSSDDVVLVHGDPHAGNLFVTPSGELAILDWSLAGRLSPDQREAMIHVLLGAMMLDERRIAAMLSVLSAGRVEDLSRLQDVVHRRMRPIRAGQLPNFQWMVRLMDDAFEKASLEADSDLLLFRKSLHTLEGVISDVTPTVDPSIDQAFFADFSRHLAAEWPQRWVCASHSRGFATRLSNTDLTELILITPLVATRFWLAQAWPGGLAITADSDE